MDLQFCVTYENHPYKNIYFKVKQEDIKKYKDKKGFKCFCFKHKPTRIAMVEIINDNLIIGEFNV